MFISVGGGGAAEVRHVRAPARPLFFAGKLVFSEENLFTRQLHNQAADTIQRRLQFDGMQMVVLPVRAL